MQFYVICNFFDNTVLPIAFLGLQNIDINIESKVVPKNTTVEIRIEIVGGSTFSVELIFGDGSENVTKNVNSSNGTYSMKISKV